MISALRVLSAALIVLALAAVLPTQAIAQSTDCPQSAVAQAKCEQQRQSQLQAGYQVVTECVQRQVAGQMYWHFEYSNQGWQTPFVYDGPYTCAASACPSGVAPPIGTQFQSWKSSGLTCYNGCSMSLAIGGANNGQMVYSGDACPVNPNNTAPDPTPPPPPSEACHADGTCTWCESISGKCVTAGKPPQTVPPSSSSTSGPNNTTTMNSTTNNSGTTSTTNTTSTTTSNGTWSSDGGSAGGGTGTSGTTSGTSTTTGSSTTTQPASSSSTQSKCTSGVCDVGQADGDTGALYSAGVDTPGSVYADFKSRVSTSPLISAATGFFTINASGSCPTWHIPGNAYWGQGGFDFTFFCDSGILAILAFAGWVVLAVAAFSAFRIALY